MIGGWKQESRRHLDDADSRSRRRRLVLRAAVRQRPPGHPGAHAERVLLLHPERPRRGAGGRLAAAAQAGRQTVEMRPEDFRVLADLKPDELRDVNFMVYHKWDNTRRFIDRLDPEQQALVTSGAGHEVVEPLAPQLALPPGELPAARSTRRASGSWLATGRCTTIRCPARTWPRPRSSPRSSTGSC